MNIREKAAPIGIDTSRTHLSQTGHLLFIDSDPSTRRSLASFFEGHNIPVCAVGEWEEYCRHFDINNPCLIILDLPPGPGDCLVALREIRSRSDVPIIVTAGHQRDEIDRVIALELGADDYLIKPFSMRELLARVRAVLRRGTVSRTPGLRDIEQGGVRFGGWHLHGRARRLLDPSGTPVFLTKGEYILLLAFLEAPQRPLSREHLLQATRIHEDLFDRSIDVQVLRLRRKLKDDPGAPRIIKTERGVGYVFTLSVDRYWDKP
jgi:two-component system, OmpR family, response regulator